MLDIDAYLDSDIPNRLDQFWALANTLREAKNTVFEQSITTKREGSFRNDAAPNPPSSYRGAY